MKRVFRGRVKETGELHIYRNIDFLEAVKLFTGKQIVLTLEKKKNKRSISQNAYLHGVVFPVACDGLNDVGYRVSLEETKTLLKQKFLIKEFVNENTGEIIESIKDTSELTTTEMMDFIAEIQQWASEYLSVYIPDPNEELEIEFDTKN